MSHSHALRMLQRLTLGLERRSDHDLSFLELLDSLVAAGGHRHAHGPKEIHTAIVLVSAAEKDLAE
jgi:hypothetical protein